ncbi:MAG: lysylphosphatidylglycerol synthase transmembrane domain-containing protein [Euryarchaeota archaeon]|nr:lysylphosphatidylglycerol synthase transmembrane domain-containing protein [Euryarchaeota archaeon]
MLPPLFHKLKPFLPLVGIILFIYLLYTLDIGQIIVAILSISPIYIILSAVLTIPVLFIRTYAWMLILKQHHINLRYFQAMKIFLIGYFYGSITPGYLGQLMRIPYMKEKTAEPYGKLFVNSVLETTIHTLSLYAMMFIGAFLIIGSQPLLFALVAIWLLSVIFVFWYFIRKERGEKIFTVLIKYLTPKQLRPELNKFASTFYQDFPTIKKLILPLLIGISTWVIVFTQEYIIVLALGLTIPYIYFLLLFPIANTAGFIPITFAGLGVREFTAIFLFSTLFSITGEKVFVFTLVGFLITDLLTGFYGLILSFTEPRKQKMFS